jgi:hypothetical protein
VSKLHPKTKKVVPSPSIRDGKILTGPGIPSATHLRARNRLRKTDAASVAAFERILERKLEPIHQEMLGLRTELRSAPRRTRRDSLDPRKKFVAEIIKSRKPHPKMTVLEILREADRRQELRIEEEHRRPVPDWRVRLWSDMKGDSRAQSYISKIRADPRYLLPFEYLSELGKKRS